MKKKSINEFLKNMRLNKKYSCRKLGRISGLSHTLLNDLELGKTKPSIYTLIKICDALDIDIFDVLSKTDYLDKVRVNVGKASIADIKGNKVTLKLNKQEAIEDYFITSDLVIVKGLNNNYIVQKIRKGNEYEKI